MQRLVRQGGKICLTVIMGWLTIQLRQVLLLGRKKKERKKRGRERGRKGWREGGRERRRKKEEKGKKIK